MVGIKHNIYLLRAYKGDGTSLLKLGYAKDIPKRFNSYKAHNPGIEFICSWYKEGGIQFERTIHSMVKSSYRNEWYSEDKLEEILNHIEGSTPLQLKSKVKFNMEPRHTSFRKLCIEYHDNRNDAEALRQIALVNPLIEQAYNSLGFSRMVSLEFNQKDIERETHTFNTLKNLDWKVVKLLGYSIGQFIESSKAISNLNEIYSVLGVAKKAKGTDLANYYEVKSTTSRINGKVVKGYAIIRDKVKLN